MTARTVPAPTEVPALVAGWYVRDHARLFGLCYHLTGRNAPAAEDLLQETFLQALRALPHTAIDGDAYYWLCAIARNLARDGARRRARHPEVPWDPALGEGTDPASPEALVCGAETHTEARARLGRLLAALTPLQAEVLRRQGAGQSYVTIGAAMGLAPGAVKVLAWRARQAARRVAGA